MSGSDSGAYPLVPVVGIDRDKCVNCHACISACPVKFCNDGSEDHVKLDSTMCIGCGTCLSACTHDARYYIDDTNAFLEDLGRDTKILAIVAPSAAANFPGQYLNLNGWLKSIGVDAVFDVSFGAELAVKSYVEHIRTNPTGTIIAQPCPVVVTYIEIYHPELIPFLAPVDSPMAHCIKMIRRFYPQYARHQIAAISPCIAKKREFVATGLGDYNVGYASIAKCLRERGESLDNFPAVEYANAPPERAVLFSSPGGLRRSIARWLPEVAKETRKIEGTTSLFDYLSKLSQAIQDGQAPRLVDCLSCQLGCNGGPLTLAKHLPLDQIEYWIEQRKKEMQEFYRTHSNTGDIHKELERVIAQYWEQDLYQRQYQNHSANNALRIPTETQRTAIFRRMHKYSPDDIYNCTACGYMACNDMATAIFNGKNRPENCHWYLAKETSLSHEDIVQREYRFRMILETSLEGFVQVSNEMRIEMVNDSLCKMLNWSSEELIGMTLYELAAANQRTIFEEQLILRNQGLRSTYEVDLVRGDGVRISTMFSASPLYDKNRRKVGSWALVSDITKMKAAEEALLRSRNELEMRVQERTQELEESNISLRSEIDRRNQVEEALRQSESRVEAILHGCPIPQFVIDRHHRVISWNKALEKYSGIKEEDVLGTTDQWRAFYPEKRPCLADLLIEGATDLIPQWFPGKCVPSKLIKGAYEATDFFPRMLGNGRWLYFTAAVIRAPHGNVIGAIETLDDITERKNAATQQESLISELETKNAELERFTYTVSHDLKSPLITIQTYLGSLAHEANAGRTDHLCEDMQRIVKAASKMQTLLDELLHLSRIGRLINAPEPVPMTELAREAATLVEGQATQRAVRIAVNPELPTVYGDRPRLLEVMQNLIDNAVKFLGEQPNPCIEIGARQDTYAPVFFVRDNGIGIEPRYHQRVFGLFDRLETKTEGTGVGLAIVKRIVEVHGGRIWVESEGVKQGSTFCFTLPGLKEKQCE